MDSFKTEIRCKLIKQRGFSSVLETSNRYTTSLEMHDSQRLLFSSLKNLSEYDLIANL